MPVEGAGSLLPPPLLINRFLSTAVRCKVGSPPHFFRGYCCTRDNLAGLSVLKALSAGCQNTSLQTRRVRGASGPCARVVPVPPCRGPSPGWGLHPGTPSSPPESGEPRQHPRASQHTHKDIMREQNSATNFLIFGVFLAATLFKK